MRVLAACLAVTCACGPAAPTGGTTPKPADVGAYPALRWVPAGATYVITGRTVGDVVASARELAYVAGLGHDFDLSREEERIRSEDGVDPFSLDSLRDTGVDPRGGFAMFSEGLSPTFAIALADPQRTASFIDERRGNAVVEVSREDGVDVYGWVGDHDVHVHWAIADGWLFVHAELTLEHETDLAWYRDLRKAGGAIAASPDLAAARATAAELQLGPATGAPPLLGVARLPALRTQLARAGAPRACLDVGAPLGRALVAGGVAGKDSAAAITVEVTGSGPAEAALAPPPGWAAARADAAIQLEWTADLDRVLPLLAACDRRDARDLGETGVRAIAAFVDQIDLASLDGRGAGWYAAHDTHLFDEVLDKIPGLSFASHTRKVGDVAVTEVSMPMVPKFAYARDAGHVTAAIGAGLIDAIVGGAPARAHSLGHLEIHPDGLSNDSWDQILHQALLVDVASRRQRTIRRLHRWETGRLDLDARPGAIVLTAHARVH